MVFVKILYNNKTYPSYSIDNNKYYFKANNKKIVYPYRLVELPDYYVGGEALNFRRNAVISGDDLELTSHLSFNVSDDTLIITEV